MRRKLLFCGWLLFLAGCIPARSPDILNATPGSPAQVANDRVTTSIFSVAYPHGWRVILSPANAPPFVTIAAPDNCTILVVASTPITNAPSLSAAPTPALGLQLTVIPPTEVVCAGTPVTQNAEAPLNSTTIYLAGVSTDAAILQTTMDFMLNSLTAP